MLTNTTYRHEEMRIECRWTEDMFENLNEFRRPDTVWSNVYDLGRRKIYLKQAADAETVVIDLDEIDFSPGSINQMLDVKAGDRVFRPFTQEANRDLISGFFHHPVIGGLMKLPDTEAMIDFPADRSKSYERTNEIVLRFLEGEDQTAPNEGSAQASRSEISGFKI
jgi:hypothetical protein